MRRLIPILLPLIALLASCGGDDPVTPTQPKGSFAPKAGFPNTLITIAGAEFGSDSSRVKVIFNGTDTARILSVSPAEIKAFVPNTATNASIAVYVDGKQKGEYADRFTVYSIMDASYRGAGYAISGGLRLRERRSQGSWSEEGTLDFILSSSLKPSTIGRRFEGGSLNLVSVDSSDGEKRTRSIDVVAGTTPYRIASLKIEDEDITRGINAPPGSLVTTVYNRIVLENLPYMLDSTGRVVIRLTAAQRQTSVKEIYRKTTGVSSQGTSLNETFEILSLGDATWTIQIVTQ